MDIEILRRLCLVRGFLGFGPMPRVSAAARALSVIEPSREPRR